MCGVGVSESYRWQEILEALRGNQRKMHQAKEPRKRIPHRLLHPVPQSAVLLLAPAVGHEDAVLRHFPLLLGQEARVGRPLWQHEKGDKRDEDGRYAFNQEEPLPRVHARRVVHVFEDTSGQEAGDDVGDGVARVPDGHAEGTFFFGVPRRRH